jgi:hypothetical protein
LVLALEAGIEWRALETLRRVGGEEREKERGRGTSAREGRRAAAGTCSRPGGGHGCLNVRGEGKLAGEEWRQVLY